MSAVTQNFQRWTFLFLGLVFAAGAVVPVAARSANPVTAAFVASTATAIPGGRSNFTNFYPGSPVGNYPCSPFKIANLAMPIPGGVGNFTSLALLASTPQLNGQAVAFISLGTDGQQGIYVALIGSLTGGFPGGPIKVADTATLIPSDSMGHTFSGVSDIAFPSGPVAGGQSIRVFG